jgi:hypothetical protein
MERSTDVKYFDSFPFVLLASIKRIRREYLQDYSNKKRQNNQFSPRTFTQSSVSFLNYENGRFSPQIFSTGSISFLNYENGHFGPQAFACGSNSSLTDSQIPFYPSPIPTHRSLLANQSCRSSSLEMEQGPRASFAEHAHAPSMACLRHGPA